MKKNCNLDVAKKTELQQFQDHLLYECKNRQNIRDILLFCYKRSTLFHFDSLV